MNRLKRSIKSCARLAGRWLLVVALLLTTSLATVPLSVSMDLLRIDHWLPGPAGATPQCVARGCSCTTATGSTATCCCHAKADRQAQSVAAITMEAGCGMPIALGAAGGEVSDEVPPEVPAWRSLPCRGSGAMLLALEVRHWQPGEGGAWYEIEGGEGYERVSGLDFEGLAGLGIEPPPPRWG